MIANFHKYCLIHYRGEDLARMKSLAQLLIDRPDHPQREAVENILMEFGQSARDLGIQIRRMASLVDEKEVDSKWIWRAQIIKNEMTKK